MGWSGKLNPPVDVVMTAIGGEEITQAIEEQVRAEDDPDQDPEPGIEEPQTGLSTYE